MRCAIYTRKSADEAADSQLSSIDAQRELCERYVESQAGEGWTLIAKRYDDLGFSGGTINRPGLRELLADLSGGQIDVVVVYKIDRLSRSIRDFLNLIDTFERASVTFISTTQSFSTTTSMGRLTLNVLLSFAQFEREMMSERRRDWVARARSRGLWTSGPSPYGYDARDLRLISNPERAKVVRYIYRRFPIVLDFGVIAKTLNERGHRNRLGHPFSGRNVRRILENRLYRGDSYHLGRTIPKTHEPIVTEAAWLRAQQAIQDRGGAIAIRKSNKAHSAATTSGLDHLDESLNAKPLCPD